jgi:hypothetical protein
VYLGAGIHQVRVVPAGTHQIFSCIRANRSVEANIVCIIIAELLKVSSHNALERKMIGKQRFALLIFFLNLEVSSCFVLRPNFALTVRLKSQDKGTENTSNRVDQDALTKASWYAVELFGKVFGSEKTKTVPPSLDKPPSSIEETRERLRIDNDREYFLSGDIDELIYSEDCIFSDPFVSFRGRDRFIKNLRNLGSFITKYSAKPIRYDVLNDEVTTKFMVKLELNLPWKPVLAWPWGVRCEIDPESFLITLHEETVSTSSWLCCGH